ncbi:related to DNA-directed RNA polymerase III chain RPC82 [Rhynchosporium secalis]|uniref:DNA-directed RNA polymerase III subunit RPC3 n=1 Tax=Rhynchosporium secalis TaxID=38038 RepID=A0A1E1MV63_RHYSE|nr:related to DNA-directed RNA polymerase III chain RPC82 [Rhynchosporium secalis]
MSRSKAAVELCALLVDETYGELTSRIFTMLLRRGRLTVRDLLKHTRLIPRNIKCGLAVLIQQGLVFHNRDSEGTTFYEANHDAAYGLARTGKIMEAVESRFGTFARDVMQNLFMLGHTSISDLAAVFESGSQLQTKPKVNGHATTNGVNGHDKEHRTTGPLHTMLAHMLQAGMVEVVVESMLRSPTDLYSKIEKEVEETFYQGGTKGLKQKEEMKLKIQARMNSARIEGQSLWQMKGKKRMASGDLNGINGNHKRRRLSNGNCDNAYGDHLYEDDGTRLDPNLVLRINYEKCTVVLRNQVLVTFARDRIGETTSLIYAAGLKLLEDKIPRCRTNSNLEEAPDGPSFTTMQLTASLDRYINTGAGIGKAPAGKTTDGKLAKQIAGDGDISMDDPDSDEETIANGALHTAGTVDDGDPFSDAATKPAKRPKVTFQDRLEPVVADRSENRMQQVKNHLQLLESDDCKFLRKCGSSGQGEWTVDFERIIEHMQRTELDTMMLENFGVFGHRLARMLKKFGKLDEKQLPNLALMKQKDVRTKLAEMQMAGVVDIQEVPRDVGRQNPNRIIFLWFFDDNRVATMILENTYKMMSRCLQRLDFERRNLADIIALTLRTDMLEQDPATYLDASQLNRYQAWRTKEEILLGQILRLDQLVGIFRDF